jgi:hypothetical protein
MWRAPTKPSTTVSRTENQTQENMSKEAITQTLSVYGPATAERSLAVIGNKAGDEELAILVQSLEVGDISALIGEGDYTKPSIVVPFITPQQFIGALERLGTKWGECRGVISDIKLAEMHEDVTDFLTSVILTNDERQKRTMLETLYLREIGKDLLVSIAVNEVGCLEFFNSDEHRPGGVDVARVEVGTWQEIFVELQATNPDFFANVRRIIFSLHADERKNPDEAVVKRYVSNTYRQLIRRAKALVVKPKSGMILDEVFGDL